eukprot:s1931_g4.t2
MTVISQAMSGGSITIQHSRAFADGGSMDVDELDLSGGNLTIDTSRAEQKGRGGALSVRMLRVSGGSLTVYDADAEADGGCLWTDSFVHSAGKVNLTLCNSAMLGGALWTNTWNKTAAAHLTIQDAQAARGAGVLASYGAHVDTENLHMSDLSARRDGGCFLTWGRLRFSGTLSLQNCRAKGSGGAIFAEAGPPKGVRRVTTRIGEEVQVEANRILCVGCAAPAASLLQLQIGHAALAEVQIRSDRASMSSMAAGPYATIEVGTLDCSESPGCDISALSSGVRRLICPRGEGRENLDEGIRCRMCPDGQTRLATSLEGESQCTACPKIPDMDIRCTATELGLPPGWMVDLNLTDTSNLSSWFRCPSELACPGGHLQASTRDPRQPDEVVPMCEKGYEGPGCTRCSHGFARGDSNVLQCVQCANGQALRHVASCLLKDLALFASAAVSVAGAKGKRTSSATLLNQLMSFAAVAGITMSGVMQTPIFQHDMEESTQEVLRYLSLPVSFAQGQTSGEAGASWECLLGSFGVEPTLQRAHILASVWPVILIASLAAAKGGWLALVVGVNVFLPACVAGFGRYLVVFRLRPEGTPLGELRWEFLPAGPAGSASPQVAAVSAATALFLALGVGSWVSVVRHRKEPLEPHVAYLTQAYRPMCAAWEVERLVRKVFLALITAMLPVTLSPALQMETVNLVLTVSLVAHLICWPYQVNAWNRVEVGLLIVALTMMGLTTSLLANALHWSKSTATQRFLVCLICSLAGGISTIMIAAFLATYVQERRSSRKEPWLRRMPEEIVPAETGTVLTSFASDALANLQLEKLKAANDGQRYVSRICRISGRVIGARGLPKMDSLSLSDPFAVVKAIKGNNRTINVHMTRTIQNTLTPVWDEEFDFAVAPHLMTEEIVGLRVAVYDSDGPFNSFSGTDASVEAHLTFG